jgi:hypothetical protein
MCVGGGGMEISGPLPRTFFSWSQVERQQKSLVFFYSFNSVVSAYDRELCKEELWCGTKRTEGHTGQVIFYIS